MSGVLYTGTESLGPKPQIQQHSACCASIIDIQTKQVPCPNFAGGVFLYHISDLL